MSLIRGGFGMLKNIIRIHFGSAKARKRPGLNVIRGLVFMVRKKFSGGFFKIVFKLFWLY